MFCSAASLPRSQMPTNDIRGWTCWQTFPASRPTRPDRRCRSCTPFERTSRSKATRVVALTIPWVLCSNCTSLDSLQIETSLMYCSDNPTAYGETEKGLQWINKRKVGSSISLPQHRAEFSSLDLTGIIFGRTCCVWPLKVRVFRNLKCVFTHGFAANCGPIGTIRSYLYISAIR